MKQQMNGVGGFRRGENFFCANESHKNANLNLNLMRLRLEHKKSLNE